MGSWIERAMTFMLCIPSFSAYHGFQTSILVSLQPLPAELASSIDLVPEFADPDCRLLADGLMLFNVEQGLVRLCLRRLQCDAARDIPVSGFAAEERVLRVRDAKLGRRALLHAPDLRAGSPPSMRSSASTSDGLGCGRLAKGCCWAIGTAVAEGKPVLRSLHFLFSCCLNTRGEQAWFIWVTYDEIQTHP